MASPDLVIEQNLALIAFSEIKALSPLAAAAFYSNVTNISGDLSVLQVELALYPTLSKALSYTSPQFAFEAANNTPISGQGIDASTEGLIGLYLDAVSECGALPKTKAFLLQLAGAVKLGSLAP